MSKLHAEVLYMAALVDDPSEADILRRVAAALEAAEEALIGLIRQVCRCHELSTTGYKCSMCVARRALALIEGESNGQA